MSIQTSIGTPTATSYISVASANTYFNNLEESSLWTQMGSTGTLTKTSRKEGLLKQATRELDRTYRFQGTKYNQGIQGQSDYQALKFPRTSNVNGNNELFIPDEIKFATYHQAYWIMQRGVERYTSKGILISPSIFSKESYSYMSHWINKGVTTTGSYSWKRGI